MCSTILFLTSDIFHVGFQHMNIGFSRCMHGGGEMSRLKLNFLQTYKEDNDCILHST